MIFCSFWGWQQESLSRENALFLLLLLIRDSTVTETGMCKPPSTQSKINSIHWLVGKFRSNSIQFIDLSVKFDSIQFNSFQIPFKMEAINSIQFKCPSKMEAINSIQFKIVFFCGSIQFNSIQNRFSMWFNSIQVNSAQLNPIQFNSIQIEFLRGSSQSVFSFFWPFFGAARYDPMLGAGQTEGTRIVNMKRRKKIFFGLNTF